MSPVFRHGRLRLYLLKLLDEAPRHGYEVIRLLQDRFLGVYAPSPGTIYPRLARLEEDGLVTHEEVDGKKVYSITDKGREEIRTRLSELADLEDELTESLRDVAREISEDVRDTVRSIREEFASAAREFRNQGRGADSTGTAGASTAGASTAGASTAGASTAGAGTADASTAGAGTGTDERDAAGSDEARRIREEARLNREQMRAGFRARGRARNDWGGWQEKVGRPDWAGWTPGSDWAGTAGEPHADPAGARLSGEGRRQAGGPGWRQRGGPAGPFSDLERIALQFATELRAAAKQAGGLGERSLNDLRDILTDTLAKVRVEVFTEGEKGDEPAGPAAEAAPSEATEADETSEADEATAEERREPNSEN
jgi:DNA-binding PadR family transcriptional regulator